MNEKSVATGTVQLFSNEEFGDIRSVMFDMVPWFVGKDVAMALGYSNASKAVMVHVDDEDKRFEMLPIGPDSQNGNPIKTVKTALINESGLYALIFGSKLESARRFKHWVTSEVLPAIRKTGAYAVKTTGQQRFDLMNQEVLAVQKLQNEMMAKLDALETARKQDRQALDNVLFVCKQLDRKLQSAQQVHQPQSEKQAEQNPNKTYKAYQPKGLSEWRTELYAIVKHIVQLSGLTVNAVLKQGYDYLGRNYGWYFKDERKSFIERTGYKGDAKNISGVDIIEASDMYKSIFMSIMKDRLENEKHDAETKKGIVAAISRTRVPPVLPADVMPVRHPIEEVEVNPAPEVVVEAHAVEVETPTPKTAEERVKEIIKKKYSYYKPSVFFPLVEPVAKKRGDNTWKFQGTYKAVYKIIGVDTMRRLERKYVRKYGHEPKPMTKIFEGSSQNMKIFTDALQKLAETI